MKLIIAISGASGVHLGEKFISKLPKSIDKYVVTTNSAKVVLNKEQNIKSFSNKDISAPIASGSFGADAMIVVPCSGNTLAKISCGISDNLLTRAAAVMIKEQKKLILAVRETPMSAIMLENMHKLSSIGVLIAPPVIGYYAEQQSIEDMENFLIGKWFDLLGIENSLYKRWQG
jgi:4-hydroxy-3-polyprenylbenzoate decarboxylase